jgi:hypothetical protein
MFSIKVQDFGPIGEGTVTLRPLTVLVGPNNAGKSYLALLTYALSGPFGRLPASYRRGAYWYRHFPIEPGPALSEKSKQWLKEQIKDKRSLRVEEFPAEIKEAMHAAIGKFIPRLAAGLSQELQRGFATKLAELARKRAADGFHVCLEQTDPELKLALSLAKGRLHVDESKWDLSSQLVDLSELRRLAVPVHAIDELLPMIVIPSLFRSLFTTSYYFPAARSGILQGHKALASSILSRVPLVGIEPFEIPTLSGVLADFIGNVLRLEKRQVDKKVAEVGAFLEERACKGKVEIGATEAHFEYPEIYYELAGSKLPLHRTSSMVSEMAPIILFLKHVVQKEDLLIIEEPEAHLHPDNQRTLAIAMVKLVRLGVRLIITTHSEYLVHQISNFVRLAGVPEKRAKLGYSKDDYLLPEEVGSYLFCFGKNGGASRIEELIVTEEDGIPEDEFARIYEALYDETLSIERSLQH